MPSFTSNQLLVRGDQTRLHSFRESICGASGLPHLALWWVVSWWRVPAAQVAVADLQPILLLDTSLHMVCQAGKLHPRRLGLPPTVLH